MDYQVVSIPERVLEALKLNRVINCYMESLVSIPERVLEALKPNVDRSPADEILFQSLKGF